MENLRARFLLCGFVTTAWLTAFSDCDAQIVSRWMPIGGSTNWLDNGNWTAGVPNAPGDVAEIPGTRPVASTIDATAPLTIGELHFLGLGSASLTGIGSLTFDNPGADPALIKINLPTLATASVTISKPIHIAASEQLLVEVSANTSLALNNGIQSLAGDVTKTGAGPLILNGASSGWEGHVYVNQGMLSVNNSTALGSTAGGTTLSGGIVRINQPNAEPFTLESGMLETTQHFLDLDGPIHLTAGNTGLVKGPFEMRGGTVGAGDLRLVATSLAATTVSVLPLSHEGGVYLSSGETARQYASFRVDNSYLGVTEISDVTLDVRTANGLGSPIAGTSVLRGTLRLHGGSQESVSLTDSTLALWSAEQTLPELQPAGSFQLKNSTLTTYGEFRGAANYIIEQPIQLDGSLNTITTERGAITLAGGVAGSGDLILDPANNHPINVDGTIDLDGGLELRGGPTRFLQENAYQGEIILRNGGDLVVVADQKMSRIRTRSLEFSGCCSVNGTVDVTAGATLQVGSVDLAQGLIRGTVITDNGIQFSGFVANRTISHLDSSQQVGISSGQLLVDDSFAGRAATNGSVHVNRSREAAVVLGRNSVTEADIFLNNGSGFNYWGALRTENDGSAIPAITLLGDIYLGAQGAHIGGTDNIRLEGQIYGGDLKMGQRRGDPGIAIVGQTAAYTGATQIFSGELVVAESGKLSQTSVIELYPEGALYVDNLPADGPVSDRIADDIDIHLYGGEVSAWPTEWEMNSRERVGTVTLKRGTSVIRGTHYFENSRQSHANLSVTEIVREPGAVLTISSIDRRISSPFPRDEIYPSNSDFTLETPLPVVNGILPAWVTNSVNFTTLGPGGRVTDYQGPFVSFSAADATSIVRPPTSASSLAGDKTIHALYAFGNVGPVNLGGHTLTVESGGVSGAVLSNGTIRPGQYANGELIFFGGVTIDANIVDNGSATSVIYVGDANIGGTNSYTGTTYIVGQAGEDVIVNRATALPSGGDIEINGFSRLQLRDPSANVAYKFGDIAIRDGGTMTAQCCGNPTTVEAESILIETGSISLPLFGNTPIVKKTEGLGEMLRSSPLYTGTIRVEEGLLHAGNDGFAAFGQGTVNVEPRGNLVLTPIAKSRSDAAASPKINLNGGSLFGAGTSDSSQINYKGTVEVTDNSTIYLLDGLAESPINTNINIDGMIHVAAGKSLTVNGRPDSNPGLRATGGIKLEAGSLLGGLGVIGAQVRIENGAILSPGLIGEKPSVGLIATSRPTLVSDVGESRMTWGQGGRFRWEINNAHGDPGAQFAEGWDMLRVGASAILDIQATPANPFVIEPVALLANGESGSVEGLTPNQHFRWLIAERGTLNASSATIQGFAADKFVIDPSTIQDYYPNINSNSFWLDVDSQGIHLNLMYVPEPATILILSSIFAMCVLQRSLFVGSHRKT